MAKKKAKANDPLMYGGLALYASLLLLFGWQTWAFVNFLFPDDQLGAKILTMISFDVMALFWSLVHTFYSFKSEGAHWWVKIAWAVTFLLSLIASVLYLVIQFFFRFHLALDPIAVNVGYSVSIVALVLNILALMAWLILEWNARHPRRHEYEEDDEEQPVPTSHYSAPPVQQRPLHAIVRDHVEAVERKEREPQERMFTEAELRAAQSRAWDEGAASGRTSPLAKAPSNQNGAKANNP